MSAPRIPPLTAAELTDEQRELVGGFNLDGPTGNIFATLVRHPGLFRKWLPFGGKLLSGKLPARDREILILRTALNCATDYEYGQHVMIAKGVGMTDDDIAGVTSGAVDPVLIAAADELHRDSKISDETWAALSERYEDERQLMEVPFVVGHYHMVGFILNSLGVEREAGVPGLPSS